MSAGTWPIAGFFPLLEPKMIGAAGPGVRDAWKARFQRDQRARVTTAILLLAPLLLWVAVNFVVPVLIMLQKSVHDPEMARVLPHVSSALASWPGVHAPPDAVYGALAHDLRNARAATTLHIAAKRLNNEQPGLQALVNRTARALPETASSWRDEFVSIDSRWSDPALWQVIRRATAAWTAVNLLTPLDLRIAPDGRIVAAADDRRVFVDVWLRTFWIAGVATLLCVALGYPLAHVIATASPRLRAVMMILVLLPFWMSLLVRTTAWVVLLQSQGVVNDIGLALGVWNERVQLIHNRVGLYITMTHILLPYVVLPLQAVMRRIPANYMRAAISLGANPIAAFWRVYFPLTVQSVGSTALLVFILAVGYYVTPALVGGPNDQMITYFIAFYTNVTLNWGASAGLAAWLLLLTVGIFWVFKSLFGLDRVKMA